MNGEMGALARRAVACKGWRWMPGMLSDEGRVVEINVHGLLVGYTTGIILKSGFQGWPRAWEASASLRLPDLTDPATLGCLLALVREAWGNKHLWVDVGIDPAMWSLTVYSIGWACVNGEVPIPADIQAESEAGVLVAALEAAP